MASDTATQAKDVKTAEPDAQTTATAEKPSAKKASPKKASPKKSTKAKTGANGKGAAPAFDDGKVVSEVREVPILSILSYDNPRMEPQNLYAEGYVLFGDPAVEEADPDQDVYISLVHMATSRDMDEVRYFVELVEKHENVDKDNPLNKSIVELANSMAELGQLVPIMLRRTPKGYEGIDGGRRITARLYLHAKARVQKADGESGVRTFPATVLATESKCKQQEMRRLSLRINRERKDFTELEEGKQYYEMLQDVNPETGRKWTMKDLAADLGVQYSTFRNRQALWVPHNGKEGDDSRGLTDAERTKVAKGTLGVTAASRKSLGEKHYSETGEPSQKRDKPIPLSAMREMFDETAEANESRRRAIAQCMGLMKNEQDDPGYKRAVKQSEQRIAAQDEADMKNRRRAK